MSNTRDISCSSDYDQSYEGEKLIYPAATRNSDPILQVLKRFVFCDTDRVGDDSPLFVEISSGSGQHLGFFAPHFPGVKFQPSEFDNSLIGSLTYYAKNCPTKNILPPMVIDIRKKLACYEFAPDSIDYMFNANMMHISTFDCTIGLFENAGIYLKPEALMITYGPYSKDGLITPESNVKFNESLKARNNSWGLRDINELIKLAEHNNMSLIDTIEMPSNNKSLIWKKN